VNRSVAQLIEDNFPGANNAGLRKRAAESWVRTGSVMGLAKIHALTTFGLKSLESLESDLVAHRDNSEQQ
jgi:hypothetical protein